MSSQGKKGKLATNLHNSAKSTTNSKILPCPYCDELVSDDRNNDGAQCEICKIWLHYNCLGVSKADAKAYGKLASNTPIKLLCSTCHHDLRGIKDLKDQISNLHESVEGIQNSLTLLLSKVESIQTSPTTPIDFNNRSANEDVVCDEATVSPGAMSNSSTVKGSPFQLYQSRTYRPTTAVYEVEERIKRKKNLMIFHMSESKFPSHQQRVTEDKKQFLNIASHLRIKGASESVCGLWRIGESRPDKARPVKIRFKTEEFPSKFMKKYKDLRASGKLDINGIHVASDLTSLQITEKRARNELTKQLRERKKITTIPL